MYRMLRVKWWLQRHKQAISEHLHKRVPKVGETIEACDGRMKVASYVSVLGDEVEYEDGSSDSYRHCGWERISG
jgi:hypothetical protein